MEEQIKQTLNAVEGQVEPEDFSQLPDIATLALGVGEKERCVCMVDKLAWAKLEKLAKTHHCRPTRLAGRILEAYLMQ